MDTGIRERVVRERTVRAISLFAGCGGSSLGYKMAGVRVLYANEFIESAAQVYRLNHTEAHVDGRDIREVKGTEIMDMIGVGVGELEIMDGSPPCASFSTSGRLEKNWGKRVKYSETTQRVDDLFYEYIRILREIMPKVFVAENVSGLTRGVAIGYFNDIRERFIESGYRVRSKLLDAAQLGVPQHRKRVFFIGVREDIGCDPVFPEPRERIISVSDVLPHIIRYSGGGRPNNWVSASRPYGTVVQDGGRLSPTAYLSTNGYIEERISNFGETKRRKLTIDELKVLSGFPKDFILTGTFEQQWERIGRAVPPPMMHAIASTILEKIFLGCMAE